MSQRTRKTSYWQDAPMPRTQLVLFPTALEERIPADHPVRLVDEILDLLQWTEWEAAYHGSHGRPPIHPSILAKVLLFAMIRRIRSSRQIEYELKHSIDFMWLTSGRCIDHTTISEFRRKYTQELRGIFQQLIKLAINLKMANLGELCIDGTRVLADANKYKTWTTKRLVRALEQLDAQIVDALKTLEANDAFDEDLLGDDISADRLPAAVSDLQARREQLAAHMKTTQAMDELRRRNGSKGPAQLPKTDPDSRILPNKEGGFAPNDTPMATTETKSGLIVEADVVIGNVEHDQLSGVIDVVAENFDVAVDRVLADTAYTTGENLSIAEQKRVELLGPLAETKCENNPANREDATRPVAENRLDDLPINAQTKRFDKSAFVYDEQADCYYCPAGKPLPRRTTEHSVRGGKSVKRNVYTCADCVGCPLASRCRKNPESKRGREVMHDEHEGARRRHRERMKSKSAQAAYSVRQHIGETPFATIKCCFDFRRFSLRGIEGVKQEWRWASMASNLKKLLTCWGAQRAALTVLTSQATS